MSIAFRLAKGLRRLTRLAGRPATAVRPPSAGPTQQPATALARSPRSPGDPATARCPNCRAALRADGRLCDACGAPITAGEAWPSLAVRVRESQRSLSVRLAELARATCAADLSLVTDANQARVLCFPDESVRRYGKFSTVCLTRGGTAALFAAGQTRERFRRLLVGRSAVPRRLLGAG